MTYILVFEYNSKSFMDVEKIITFKQNIKKINEKNGKIKMVFYADVSNEELAVFMSYFNSLASEKLCDFSISLKTKEVVWENGINNKSIKLSSHNAKQAKGYNDIVLEVVEAKDKNFDNIIKENYNELKEDFEIRILPTKDWENIVLDLLEV